MFNYYTTIEDVRTVIRDNPLVFLYIGQPNCSVCHSLKPQLERLLAEFQDDIMFVELDAMATPEVASEYQVMAVPALLLFYEGHEYLRKARIVNTGELYESVKKVVAGVRSLDETEGGKTD